MTRSSIAVSEAAGQFNFSSALTSCDPNDGAPCSALNFTSTASGNAIASMLLGTASGGGQGININPAMSLHSFGVYLQDQGHVTPQFTINMGLRYENQRPATERFNRLMYFNLNVPNPVGDAVSPLYNQPSTKYLSGLLRAASNMPATVTGASHGRRTTGILYRV